MDADLPADVDGAPRANRKLTKVRLSMRSWGPKKTEKKKGGDQKAGSACVTGYTSITAFISASAGFVEVSATIRSHGPRF